MSADVKVRCPKCKSVLRVLREALERPIRCQHCDKSFRAVLKQPEAVAPKLPPPIEVPPPAKVPESLNTSEGEPDFNFAFSDLGANSTMNPIALGTHKRSATHRALFVVGAVALIATAAGAAALQYSGWLNRSTPGAGSGSGSAKVESNLTKPAEPPPIGATRMVTFPRRLLFIGIHQYVYANPIAPTPTTLLMPGAIREFAEKKLRISRDQVTVLSDLASERDARPPLKSIVESTVERFLESSRPQDRIVIVFVGHALDLEDEAYLVPIDGDLTEKKTLVPLKWLYDRIAACPARQKILIVDSCRFDSARGFERPGGGPMSAKLEAALSNPPSGVQVWSACSANQHSYEFEQASANDTVVRGGAFLSLLFQSRLPASKPEDSIPMELLVQQTHGSVGDLVRLREGGAMQTPRLSGQEPAGGSPYDPDQSMPSRIDLPTAATLLPGGKANPKEVERLLAEISVPPLKLPRDSIKGQATPDGQASALAATFPFSAETMNAYAADYESLRDVLDRPKEYPMRVAVLKAVETLDRQGRQNRIKVGDKEVSADSLIEKVRNLGNDDAVKKSLTKSQQDGPALMLVELQETLELMERVGRDRQRDPSKRWQAHYDYVLAQLKMRMVYVHEYNVMIAKVKRDELPKLDAKIHNGWRLAAQEKIASPKEVKDLAGDARKLMAKLIQEHPGTPWEVLAKRERSTALGLAWQPTNLSSD